jgi:hypothetical protein
LLQLAIMESQETQTLSIEKANELVLEHQGWAESIARSVARAWNMDWKSDGLDGAAMEALIFCARRFQPNRGIPFRGYARKRIHEASADQARKCKSWQMAVGSGNPAQQEARDISIELLHIFPELRTGHLPLSNENSGGEGENDTRSAIRQLLVGASFIAARQGISTSGPDEVLDYKRMIEIVSGLEVVHQLLVWKIYWDGLSLRNLAEEWETDELNVIREHKTLLAYLCKQVSVQKQIGKPKVRPGLRIIALKLKKDKKPGIFTELLKKGASK